MYIYITAISDLTHAKSGASFSAIGRFVICSIHDDGARREWHEGDKGRRE